MNKLKLHLEDLAVESFDTCTPARDKGTVFAEQCSCGGTCAGQATCDYTCDDATCPYTCDDNTCAASCNGSCDASCYGTCGEYTCALTCEDTCRPRLCGTYQTGGYYACPLPY
jgi:hypothetical protein